MYVVLFRLLLCETKGRTCKRGTVQHVAGRLYVGNVCRFDRNTQVHLRDMYLHVHAHVHGNAHAVRVANSARVDSSSF